MKSVYSAVRTVSLNRAVCAWALKGCLDMENVRAELWKNIYRTRIDGVSNKWSRTNISKKKKELDSEWRKTRPLIFGSTNERSELVPPPSPSSKIGYRV